ncbi:MAG TPA: methyltransferase domain-containing protein [Kofleriaceae bacterium]|nr:methyltransferase domain-containing protein [Kofleriaceae bacterium]
MTWDPAQYARFQAERSRPFFDLLAMVEARASMRVLDLGCGSGELTRAMHEKLGAARTLGVDSSPAMLARAAPLAGDGLEFAPGRIQEWPADGAWDLVYANASLHWIEEQPRLLAHLRGMLAAGGQLAFHVPANHDHASHLVAGEVAEEEPFAAALRGWSRGVPVLAPRTYDEVLYELGFPRRRVELRIYGHEMPSIDAVVEWNKGASLTVYAERLGELWPAFLDRYRVRLRQRLGDRQPYYYTYARIFAWACLN